MADVIVDYAAVPVDTELEGDIQIRNMIDNVGGIQNLNEGCELEGCLQMIDKIIPDDCCQMIKDKADLNHAVQVINEKTEPDDNLQKNIKIESKDTFEKIESESGELEKNDEKIRSQVDEQPQTNEENGPPDNDNVKNSTGNSSLLRGEGKVLPRYLRAPIGSCHDLCKYGIKHGFEAKERNPFWKWLPARSACGKGKEKVTITVEGKKKATTSPKLSPSPRTGKPKDPVMKAKSFSMDNSLLSFEEIDAPVYKMAVQKRKSDKSNSSSSQKQKGFSQTEINESRNGSRSRKSTEGRNRTVRKPVADFEPSTVSSPQKESRKKSSTTNVKDAKNVIGPPHQIKLRNTVIKTEQVCNGDYHMKTLHVIECTAEKEPSYDQIFNRVLKIDRTSASPLSSRKSRDPKSVLPPSSRTSRAPTSGLPMFPKKSFRGAGSRLDPNKSASLPSTKALRPTQQKVHRAWSSSPLPAPSSSASPPSISKSSSSYGKRTGKHVGNNYGGQAAKVVYKVRSRIGAIVAPGNNLIPPRKLSFRRGRVIELPEQQISAPRRLKFRQPRPLGEIENGNSDYRKRIMRTKEVNQSELTGIKTKSDKLFPRNQCLDLNKRSSLSRKEVYETQFGSTKGVSEQIVLRHQMVEGKRSLRHLYNNVIEETASKLAETRKSKVKALVGAFETVISLEDSKPVAIATAC